MKALKYSLAALGVILMVIVLAALIANQKREALALTLANRILAGSGLVVTDLSIATLTPRELRFSKLVLQQSSGARYEFIDLKLPLALPDVTVTHAAIGEFRYVPADTADETGSYAELIDLLLELPAAFPDKHVEVGSILVPGFPVIDDLDWQALEHDQLVSLTLEGRAVEIETHMLDASHYEIKSTVFAPDAAPGIVIDLKLAREHQGYRALGTASLELAPSLSLLRDLNFVDQTELEVDGRLTGAVEVDIETEHRSEVRVRASLARSPDTRIRYASDDGIDIQTAGAETYELTAAYPGPTWSVGARALSAVASVETIKNISLSLHELRCDSTLQCELAAQATLPAGEFDGISAKQLRLATAVSVSFADALDVRLQPTALNAGSLHSSGWSIASLALRNPINFKVAYDLNGLHASAKEVTVDIQSAKLGDELVSSLPLTLRDLTAASEGLTFESSFDVAEAAASLTWQSLAVAMPRLGGKLKLSIDKHSKLDGKLSLKLSSRNESLDAQLAIFLRPNKTSVQIDKARLAFAQAPLSKRLHQWPYLWDLVAGTADVEGQIEIDTSNASPVASGEVEASFADVAGQYADLVATGASGTVPITIHPETGLHLGPARLGIALLDVGLPIENLNAGLDWHSATDVASITGLTLSVLGGTASAAPFRYRLDDQSASFTLKLKAIQLPLIAQMADFEDLQVSGAVSGLLPVEVNGNIVKVSAGRLASEDPGGLIRYAPGANSVDASALGLARKALSNLQYETLTSDVSYDPQGNLQLKMRLKGINPEYDPLQPVILNLSIENNIPQLLRSLQATRDIEDILEQRTGQ